MMPRRDEVIVDIVYSADASSLPHIRAAVAQALDREGIDGADPTWIDLQVAVSEAVTNVVRHGGADTVRVTISRRDDELSAVIVDDGVGIDRPAAATEMPDPNEHGGRGIPLMRALVDSCDVRADGHGTRVVLSKRLPTRR